MPPHEVHHDDLLFSDRQELIDVAFVHDFLAHRSYWAQGIPLELVERAVRNSLSFGVYRAGRQIGFARVITDRATFGWLADVFVLETERGRGIGKRMIAALLAHPDLAPLRRLMFVTSDAQGFYAPFGFRPDPHPERFMAIRRENPYKTATAVTP